MIPEDIKREIGFAAAKYSKYEDEGILGTNATKFNVFDDGASFGYSLSQPKIEELEKEVESCNQLNGLYKHKIDELYNECGRLKEKVDELTMADMTHEYNEAEAEKFQPEYERQIKEPLEQEIERLTELIELAFQFTPRLDTQWQQFKLDNNL